MAEQDADGEREAGRVTGLAVGLLTWTTYGTWLAGPGRGRVPEAAGGGAGGLPEPDARESARRGGALGWPRTTLSAGARRLVTDEIVRIGRLRVFTPLVAVAAPDHVHLLLATDPARPVPRLVQLVKGALSRALSVDAGDAAARTDAGRPLPHHKWWARQHAFRWLAEEEVERVREALVTHGGAGVVVREYGRGED